MAVSIRAFTRLIILSVLAGVVVYVTTPFPDPLPLKWEIKFGAAFVDVTDDVLTQRPEVTYGALDEMSQAQAAEIRFDLSNLTGDYTPERFQSIHFPYVQLGVEVRLSVFWNGEWHVRFHGEASEWLPVWPWGDVQNAPDEEALAEAHVQVVASGILRRLGQGRIPIRSAMFRSMSGIAPDDYRPLDYWPMEDGADAAAIATGVAGGTPGTLSGTVTLAEDDTLLGSQALPLVAAGGSIAMLVRSYTDTNQFAVQIAMKRAAAPAAATTFVEIQIAGALVGFLRLEINPAASPKTVSINAYSPAGTLLGGSGFELSGDSASEPSEATFFGTWVLYTIGLHQFSGQVTTAFGYSSGDGRISAVALGVLLGAGATGQPTLVRALGGDGAGTRFGHSTVYVDPAMDLTFIPDDHDLALTGYTGEQAHIRAERLAREAGLPIVIIGDESQPMGPQQPDTMINLFNACADVDMGIFGECHDQLALLYRCGSTIYNQDPMLVLDAAVNEMANPFAPTKDDQGLRNDVTVGRIDGSSYRSVRETGPKSIQAPPDGVGPYDEGPLALNLETDDQAKYNAEWRTWLGTWPGMRYPSLSPAISVVPDVADDWLAALPGDRVDAVNLPAQHPSGGVAVIVRGWTETYTKGTWEPRINASPAGPYDVGIAGDDDNPGAWLQTEPTTRLEDEVVAGSTTASVIVDGPLFSTDDADIDYSPLEIIIGGPGGEVRGVSDISGASSPQTFTFTEPTEKTWPADTSFQVYRPLVAAL